MKISKLFISALVFSVIASGCATTLGTIGTHSEFVYPNSNVTPLGHTSGTWKKTTFLFPPKLTKESVDGVLSNALSKYEGADILLDFDYIIKYITIPILPIYTIKLEIEGTAANMEVGKQDIGQGK